MKKFVITLLWAQNNKASMSYHIAVTIIRIFTGLALCTVFEKFMPRNGVWGPQDWFISDIEAMGFPVPEFFALVAVSTEFFGGILLMFGLFTRPAALLNAMVTLVAAFLYHNGDIGNTGLTAFTFLILTVALTFTGGGKFSLDYLLFKKLKSKI